MADERKLDGKVAIVTGAGSSGPGVGTGKAISVLFAREGARVALVDRFEERAKETLALIEAEGGEATIVTADLTEVAACQRIVDETVARYGGVDILVNNAAITLPAGILDTTPEQYDQVLATNLTAPFMLTRAVLPVMVARGGGSIVNITSIAALRGQGGSGTTAYATAKAGLLGLTTDVADAFGNAGIRVELHRARDHRHADAQRDPGPRRPGPENDRPLVAHCARHRRRRLGHRPRRAVRRRPGRSLHHRRSPPGRRWHDRTVPLIELASVSITSSETNGIF